MKIKIIASAVLLLMMLGGCAIQESVPYKEPTGPDTASLTIRNDASDVLQYISIYNNGQDCTGNSSKLSKDGSFKSHYQETIKIKASSIFTFSVYYLFDYTGNTHRECFMLGSFMPAPGNNYVARFNQKNQRCYLQVYRVAGQKAYRVPSFHPRQGKDSLMHGFSCK